MIGKGLRRTPLRVRGGSRFPRRRNEPYRRYIERQPCSIGPFGISGVRHQCDFVGDRRKIEGAHLKTQGSGGDDVGNMVPLCPTAHDLQEGRTDEFEREFGVDLYAHAADLAEKFEGDLDEETETIEAIEQELHGDE